jgi:hypothetical protein
MMSRPFSTLFSGLFAASADGGPAWTPSADALLSVNRVIDDIRRGAIGGLRQNPAAAAVRAQEAAGRDPTPPSQTASAAPRRAWR